jgi:Tol biopolymer transport system component
VFYDPAISPDGTTLALEAHATDLGSTDLFTVDLDRGAGSALTSAPGFESTPTWSPDSKRIAFSSDQNSPSLRVKNVGSPGDGDILLNQRGYASSWSRDGRYLLFNSPGGATGWDVWLYDFQTKEARAFINSPVNEFGAVISPDGKLVAYCADESRDAQIFIRAFSDASAKIAVTASGGRQPSWSKTGDELFFLAPDTTLMAVKVKIGTPVTSDIVGEPKALFRTNVDPSRVIRNQYVVTPDGQRIMVLSPVVHPDASPLIGILNWMPK